MNKTEKYTATIYVAAPGTDIGKVRPSVTGHMYVTLAHGEDVKSYGFAPRDDYKDTGLGRVYDEDLSTYKDPYYSRTIEITPDQYHRMQDFAGDPAKHGFDMHYKTARNSCTDYAWGILNHGGLHMQLVDSPFKEFEGTMKPTGNIPAIESIKAPFPESELNKVERNPLPKQDWLQFLLSDNDRAMMDQVNRGVATLDAKHGRTPDEASERMCGSLFCLAKENGLSRVDHVLLSGPNAEGHTGTNVFVVQGEPSDPAHLRASMPTATAAQTPVHESMAQAERLTQTQQQVAQQQDHAQVQEQQAAAVRMG